MTDNSRIIVADTAGVAEAVAVLRAGGIAAVPTETVYGLAARAADADAVAGLVIASTVLSVITLPLTLGFLI